ncbi:aldo/keto reductase [Ruminococcus sp. Marseille-P6503]|uniref:aldo/keto reductase n=1 Tax=Ruminococcus sp. Marseille-P6503 TaxID=2364796 RepID=UPI000F542CE9|nr:aldo/keto reductase [Ruminococcus sp. Marseille-P6503]
MKTRKLGEITVSEVGMGCMAFSHGYGKMPSEQYSIEAIQNAYAYGCTFFDTAEIYSPNLSGIGHNERIVGKALHDVRGNVVIGTKLFLSSAEVRREGSVYGAVRRHLEGSLDRLQTDYTDIYYLHRTSGGVRIEEVAETMGRLVEEELIRGWGLSQVDVIDRAQQVTPLSAIQNIYSMVERDMEQAVIPYCMEHNIGVVPFSPIASGLLSGKITTDTKFERNDDVRNWVPQLSRQNIAANQPIVDLLGRYAKQKDATSAQISLAWMLHKYPNVVPIPGSKNKDRIVENLNAAQVELTTEEFESLEESLNQCRVYGHRGFTR